MSDLSELYQEVILDHFKKPRNFREMDNATHDAEGQNPMCGDKIKIYVHLNDDGTIDDVSFLGSGCAISKASASLMTTQVKGKTPAEVSELFDHVHKMLTGEQECPPAETLGKLRVLSGVCEFPVRVKCATLAWHALHAALKDKEEPVSTE